MEAWQRAFVRDVLSGVSVADDIEPHGDQAAIINVPYADLHATNNSTMEAVFEGHPRANVNRTVRLELGPENKTDDGRTECDIRRNLVSLRSDEERRQYIESRKKPIIGIGMTVYDRRDGPIVLHGETTGARQ